MLKNEQIQNPSSTEQSFVACVMKLQALTSGKIPANSGYLAHALFLDMVRQIDPELAAFLHDGRTRKPFTVSALQGLGPDADGLCHVGQGQVAWLRFTLLDDMLLTRFLEYLMLGGSVHPMQVGDIRWSMLEVITDHRAHPWAGEETLTEILAAPPTNKVRLHFHSPTCFSLGDRRFEYLPRADLVFDSLMRRWELVTGLPVPEKVQAVLQESLLASRFELRTEVWHFRKYIKAGAVGTCVYTLVGQVPDESLTWVSRLARFAFYSGVGYKCTMGMGQTRPF